MSNEFKIKIVSDSSGNPVSLTNIPLDAADALKVFFQSLTEFAKSYNNDDIKLSLENGSIETGIIFPETEEYIAEDIDDIISGRSHDNYRIKLFKDMQDKILQNGIDYKVFLKSNGNEAEVTNNFKGRKFPLRRPKKDKQYEINFIEGFLYEAGGLSKTNVHIQYNDKDATIECTRSQAKQLNERLYSSIFLSVTKKTINNNAFEYTLIDSYLKEDIFLKYKKLHESIMQCQTFEKYDILHYFIKNIILSDDEDNQEIIKIIRLYDHLYVDRGILRTILMALKPIIKNNEGLVPYYDRIAATFRNGSKSKMI
ncbi:MAG: hypothetical protein J6O88_05590 [Chryseobacterium sp.]|uniref:hypothetical protein n=1 Tax=Chryseobacterium sp. TaxID=1871047 RepID=UPI001B1A113A|nr:hypothetical protein [Chryseobacterium sp.]MBO6184155.1 hypothetical protein [Chryseobacterium sp.]